MPKNAKSKLIAAGITLLLSFLLMTGTTLAWYTISVNPEISGITMSIAAFETILIARDDKNVEDPHDLDFKETVDISDIMVYYNDLTPVSTVNLQQWFIPTYARDGKPNEPDKFIMDDKLEYANRLMVETDSGGIVYQVTTNPESSSSITISSAIPLTGLELLEAEKKGYYVYTDVWLKSTAKDGSDVRLSFPQYSIDKASAANEMGGFFGTYVLPQISLTVADDHSEFIKSVSRNAETSLRIGFQIYGNGIGSGATDYYIFEPNADRHSADNKPDGDGEYVVGYDVNSSAYSGTSAYVDGVYIPTQPIGYDFTKDNVEPIPQYDENGYPIYLYTKVTDPDLFETVTSGLTFYIEKAGTYDGYTMVSRAQAKTKYSEGTDVFTREQKTEMGNVHHAFAMDLDPDRLIVQMAGAWNTEAAGTREKLRTQTSLNSTDILNFGSFVNTGLLYGKLAALKEAGGSGKFCTVNASSYYSVCTALEPETDEHFVISGDNTSQVLLHLNYDEPVKVRLFFWVEGQDADCWNDIASGSFRVNIEFAG